MGWARRVAHMGRGKVYTGFWWGNTAFHISSLSDTSATSTSQAPVQATLSLPITGH
jgi:hypothetical protein